MFIAATDEALTMLEKCLNAESPPDPTLPGYAVREHDLSEVRGAYDIRVASPEEVLDEPDPGGEQLRRAELLRDVLRDVRGNPTSSALTVGIGREGASSTRLALRLAPTDAGVSVLVDPTPHQQQDDLASQVVDAIESTDLLSIYYESGHTYTNRQIARQTVISPPFRSIMFCDFTGFNIKQEKPAGGTKQIHRRIGQEGDGSLFSWIQRECRDGWLICDDGAGEVADFLHLQEDGTLRVIDVKPHTAAPPAAGSQSPASSSSSAKPRRTSGSSCPKPCTQSCSYPARPGRHAGPTGSG